MTNEWSCCPDARCTDPVFAASHPLICGSTQTLVLKPSSVMKCVGSDLQFAAFVRNSQGEQGVSNVSFLSSDPSIVVVDPATGAAAALAVGTAVISATWQGLVGVATVRVLADPCCDGVCVQTAIVQDNSRSMGQVFGTPLTKGEAAHALARVYADTLKEEKDYDAVISFNEAAILQTGLVSSVAALAAALAFNPSLDRQTNLGNALAFALATLGNAPACGTIRQQVVLLISDGENQPAMGSLDLQTLIELAATFKASGGIVICVGVRATGDGFTLLQGLSSGGYFLNVTPDNYTDSLAMLAGIMCYFCAGETASYGGYYSFCTNDPIPAQRPESGLNLDFEMPL